MKWELADKALDSDFLRAVEKLSGQNISGCYQCGKCSGGCPVATETENSPSRVLRMLQLGLEKEARDNDLVWGCAGCSTCNGRCPEGIDIVRVLDSLRALAVYSNAPMPKGAGTTRTFYTAFLDSVRDFGRLSEVGLMGGYNINSGRLFTNVDKAPWFLIRRKIGVTAHKVKQLDRLERVFARSEAIEQARLDELGEKS